jgi:hypothetical protein
MFNPGFMRMLNSGFMHMLKHCFMHMFKTLSMDMFATSLADFRGKTLMQKHLTDKLNIPCSKCQAVPVSIPPGLLPRFVTGDNNINQLLKNPSDLRPVAFSPETNRKHVMRAQVHHRQTL